MKSPQISKLQSSALEALLDCYGKTRFNKEFYTEKPAYQKRMEEVRAWIKESEMIFTRENYSEVFKLLDKRFRKAEF